MSTYNEGFKEGQEYQKKKDAKAIATFKTHNDILVKLGDELAEYLTDKEESDYHDQCLEAGRDEYTIDVDDMWHIYQTVLYWKYLSGYEIDSKYRFTKAVV